MKRAISHQQLAGSPGGYPPEKTGQSLRFYEREEKQRKPMIYIEDKPGGVAIVCRKAMNNFQKYTRLFFTTSLLIFLSTGASMAQGDPSNTGTMPRVEMATGLRSNGKIYVVVAVLVIILFGLISYLIRLDRKITRMEKGSWKE